MDQGKQLQAAIIGPAGTGKSYLLQALIKQLRSQCLVVCKLAPSGVAAHLIGGTTIYNFFSLDLELNCSLENGTFQTTRLRKTNVIVVDEFKCLTSFFSVPWKVYAGNLLNVVPPDIHGVDGTSFC